MILIKWIDTKDAIARVIPGVHPPVAALVGYPGGRIAHLNSSHNCRVSMELLYGGQRRITTAINSMQHRCYTLKASVGNNKVGYGYGMFVQERRMICHWQCSVLVAQTLHAGLVAEY